MKAIDFNHLRQEALRIPDHVLEIKSKAQNANQEVVLVIGSSKSNKTELCRQLSTSQVEKDLYSIDGREKQILFWDTIGYADNLNPLSDIKLFHYVEAIIRSYPVVKVMTVISEDQIGEKMEGLIQFVNFIGKAFNEHVDSNSFVFAISNATYDDHVGLAGFLEGLDKALFQQPKFLDVFVEHAKNNKVIFCKRDSDIEVLRKNVLEFIDGTYPVKIISPALSTPDNIEVIKFIKSVGTSADEALNAFFEKASREFEREALSTVPGELKECVNNPKRLLKFVEDYKLAWQDLENQVENLEFLARFYSFSPDFFDHYVQRLIFNIEQRLRPLDAAQQQLQQEAMSSGNPHDHAQKQSVNANSFNTVLSLEDDECDHREAQNLQELKQAKGAKDTGNQAQVEFVRNVLIPKLKSDHISSLKNACEVIVDNKYNVRSICTELGTIKDIPSITITKFYHIMIKKIINKGAVNLVESLANDASKFIKDLQFKNYQVYRQCEQYIKKFDNMLFTKKYIDFLEKHPNHSAEHLETHLNAIGIDNDKSKFVVLAKVLLNLYYNKEGLRESDYSYPYSYYEAVSAYDSKISPLKEYIKNKYATFDSQLKKPADKYYTTYSCFVYDNGTHACTFDPCLKELYGLNVQKFIAQSDLKKFQSDSKGGMSCTIYALPKIVYDNPLLNLEKKQVDKLVSETGLSYSQLLNATDFLVQNGMDSTLNEALINNNFAALIGGVYEEQ